MHHQMDAYAQELEKLVTQYLEMVEKDAKESATLQNKIRMVVESMIGKRSIHFGRPRRRLSAESTCL